MPRPFVDKSDHKWIIARTDEMKSAILQFVGGGRIVDVDVWEEGGRVYISITTDIVEPGKGMRAIIFNACLSASRSHQVSLQPGRAGGIPV